MSDIPVIDPTMTPAWDKLDQLADTFEPDLRKMFHEDPENNWTSFAAAYREELKASADLKVLAQQIKAENPQRVTLLYAFKNKIRNHAVVLQEELQQLLQDA